jgi:hypothetical protein
MQERSSKPATKKGVGIGKYEGKRGQGPPDPNVHAFNIVQMAIGEMPKPEPPKKNEAAVTLGRLGGLKGGKARAASMTPERRFRVVPGAPKHPPIC